MVTPNHEIFFLEVNTRLQVEHGVTELITGLDLVLLQFEIAQTNKLPITQSDVLIHGHSIQARIYAENPRNNFAPSTGILNYVEFASHHNGRIEETLSDGVLITPHFDPMIAKVLGRGQIREEARKTIVYLLSNTIISGIDTNIDLLLHILTREQYKKNNVHTKSIQSFLESFPIKNTGTKTIGIEALALGATVLTREAPTQQTAQTPASSRWKEQLWKT